MNQLYETTQNTIKEYFIVRNRKNALIKDAVLCNENERSYIRWALQNHYNPKAFCIDNCALSNLQDVFNSAECFLINEYIKKPKFNQPATKVCFETDLLTKSNKEENVQNLEKLFLEYSADVDIVAGEANIAVYSNHAKKIILAQLNKFSIKNDEYKTRMVCGPVLMIKEGFKSNRAKGTIIPELAKHENFILYFSNKRQKQHFRIGGDELIYMHDYHPVCESHRVTRFYTNNIDAYLKYRNLFDEIITSSDVRISKNPQKDFLFLTYKELLKFRDILKKHELEYENLNKEQLEDIILKYNITKL